MDRRVTPTKEVTSPTWGPPPPCKQAITRSWMKRVVLQMYFWSHLLQVSWYTAFLRKHNPVLEMGHLSLVYLRSFEVWDRACLSV